MTAGGLRTLLLGYDGAAERPILASVPTATDKSDRITGNEISGLMISLPVHIADPIERARLVALATQIAKEDHEILGPELYGRLMAYLPTAFAPAAFRWLGRRDIPNKLMNLAVSSVVGPRQSRPFRRRDGHRNLFDRRAFPGRSGQHHRVELRRSAWHRGAHRRPDLQGTTRSDRCHHRRVCRITQCCRNFRLSGQHGIKRRIEQAQPVVGRSRQRFNRVLGMRHQPDDSAVG